MFETVAATLQRRLERPLDRTQPANIAAHLSELLLHERSSQLSVCASGPKEEADLVEAETGPLDLHDDPQPRHGVRVEPPLPARPLDRSDQSAPLVVADCGSGETGAPREFTDREEPGFCRCGSPTHLPLACVASISMTGSAPCESEEIAKRRKSPSRWTSRSRNWQHSASRATTERSRDSASPAKHNTTPPGVRWTPVQRTCSAAQSLSWSAAPAESSVHATGLLFASA